MVRGRLRFAVAVALLCVVGAGLTVAVGGGAPPPGPEADCAGIRRSGPAADPCYVPRYLELMRRAPTVNAGVAQITRGSRRRPGTARCHVIMHGVGLRWARKHRLGLADLDGVLPRSRDDGCASGFAHGVISAMAPRIDPDDPQEAVQRGCAAIKVRYEQLHCVHGFGHAFSRVWSLQVGKAVAMCSRLAEPEAYNCSHGALMDYWMARAAEKAQPPPRGPGSVARVCALSSPKLVQLCWFRATWDLRLSGPGIRTSRAMRKVCAGLGGPARRGCVAATSMASE